MHIENFDIRQKKIVQKDFLNSDGQKDLNALSVGIKDTILLRIENCISAKAAEHQASLTAGTVMHGSRTSLLIWFWAIYLIATNKRGLSALALSKKLDLSYWKAWTMTQKIRRGNEGP